MPLYRSLQLRKQVNTHKNLICQPDEKMNLKHFHILENICIPNDLFSSTRNPPAIN